MLRYVLRATLATVLMFTFSSLAAAQYGGGGGMGGGMPGSPTYNPHRSYSNKGAIIGGVAGGAALVGGLLYWRHHHNSAKLQGCLTGNGDKLVSEKDRQTYSLSNTQNETLKPGDRVELRGKMMKDDPGEPTFEVQKKTKDLGQCTPTTAEAIGMPH
jgi:hypothetical protein